MTRMIFKELEYSDRELVSERLRAKNSYLSEYSFTNAYLFRKPHQYEVAICDNCTMLKGVTYDNATYLTPVCALSKIPLDTLKYLAENVDCFFPIEEDWLKYFPEEFFNYSYLDGDSDYIYKTERLALFPGRKLSKKRNLLKQFNTNYPDHKVELIVSDNCSDAIKVLDIWLKESVLDGSTADYDETKEAVEKFDELHLIGYITYVDNKPIGFVLGEELKDNTYALHFAKGSKEYKGIYQHLYNSLAKTLLDKYEYINFEQDLGKDTLRQAKSTYYPDIMKVKYRVSLKK